MAAIPSPPPAVRLPHTKEVIDRLIRSHSGRVFFSCFYITRHAGLLSRIAMRLRLAFAQALSLINSDAPQIFKARFLSLRGRAKKRVGCYEDALRDIEHSLALNEHTVGVSELLPDLTNAAGVLLELRRFDEALHYYEKCAALRPETDLLGRGRDLANIGATYKQKGNYELAIDYITRAYAIQYEVGDWYGAATDLNNLGQVHFQLGGT